jgi:hypothetical protein
MTHVHSLSRSRSAGTERKMCQSETCGKISETKDRATNTGLAMVKAAINTRADNVTDLAQSDPWR